jgi:hypothetical protein
MKHRMQLDRCTWGTLFPEFTLMIVTKTIERFAVVTLLVMVFTAGYDIGRIKHQHITCEIQ